MIKRRTMLAGLAATTVAAAVPGAAHAQSWKQAYPELVFAVVPAENASGVTEHMTLFTQYLTRQLGTPVTLRIANDYAAVIEGQRAGNIHIGYYGPAAFARALMTGVKTTAFVIDVYAGGLHGYYSAFFVKADSPYKTIADLKGQALGVVDPNSMSGYDMPFYALTKLGLNPQTFFGKILVTGSHENAVFALLQGTVQACVNWYDAPGDSNVTRMINKGMIKGVDGKPASEDDFRVILKSDLIINSPAAYLDSLPADLKAAIREAFLNAPKNDPAAFAKISDGKNLPWEPIDNSAYDDTIKLIRYMDQSRKKNG